jgi:autotransporter-associated beta strand protein
MNQSEPVLEQRTVVFPSHPGRAARRVAASSRRIAVPLVLLSVMAVGLPHALAADAGDDVVPGKDSLTVSKGTYVCGDDSLKAVSRYVINGTFFSNLYVSPKFPCGGTLHIDPGAAGATRLNPQATLVFNGGYLFLDASEAAAVEQVRQIQFQSGMSEIRLDSGENAGGGASLHATDASDSVTRQQGAAVMIAGSERYARKGFDTVLGTSDKLQFAGSMDKYLKGGGGAAGSMNRSIIPWMIGGTYLQPGVGGLVTYDPSTGVRCLASGEYDKKLIGTSDRNVMTDNCTLGDHKTQTINALIFRPYYGMGLGAGSTLKITSGFLQMAGSSLSGPSGPSALGFHPHERNWRATAGTLDFGSAEGVIWSDFEGRFGPNLIGAVIAGSGGLTVAGSNTLILLNANTYTGKTCVASGILQIGEFFPTEARLGGGDVDVAAGATLRIKSNIVNGIADTATVTLLRAGKSFYGMMDLEGGVKETVGGLVLDGKAQPDGAYGSNTSAAEHKLDNYFTGSGILVVRSHADNQ